MSDQASAPPGSVGRRPESQLDPFSPQAIAAPVDWDAELLAAGPIVWLAKHRVWAIGRHAEVGAAMQDWESFGSAERAFSNPNFSFPRSLVADDPPTHTVSRSVMNKILSGPALRGLEARVAEEAGQCVESCMRRGSFDVVKDLVQPYILKVMGDSIGMKESERHRLLPFGLMVQNTPGPPDETFMESFRNSAAIVEWVADQCQREALADEGFGASIYAAADRGDIQLEEAPILLLAFLGAGIDTTVAGIVNAIHALITNKDQWRLLSASPELARSAFEEALRYAPPVRFATRVARKDVSFAGSEIRRGDGMLLFFSAAARDPRRWERHDCYDLKRNTIGHLTFGRGIHNCVGQMMARMEAVSLLHAIATRIEDMEISGTPMIQKSNQLATFAKLPVTVSPGRPT